MKIMNKMLRTMFFAVVLAVPHGLYALEFTFINKADDTIRLRIVSAKTGYDSSLPSLVCKAKNYYITLESLKESTLKTTCGITAIYVQGYGMIWNGPGENPRKDGTGTITKIDSKYTIFWQ